MDNLPLFHYGLIMADPPWHFDVYSDKGNEKSPQAHYDTMSLDEIKAITPGHHANKDCILWLWATNPNLPQAIEVMAAWGFRYVTAGHWVKRTKNGKLGFGTGYVLRCAGEPYLIGANGSPETARNVRSVIEGPVREHSRKPDEAFAAAESLTNGPYLELFSRQSRNGWDVWGNETSKFKVAA